MDKKTIFNRMVNNKLVKYDGNFYKPLEVSVRCVRHKDGRIEWLYSATLESQIANSTIKVNIERIEEDENKQQQ